MSKKTINVPILARVEGEGALELDIENNKIKSLQLRIYEPPRYFEKFIEGRNSNDVIDIVARICGICPIAYQMSAAHAFESIFNVNPGSWVRDMRRVIYCGEWLQSHSLHIHLLAAPDFLGFSNAIEMAAKYPNEVKRGMKLQRLGNELIRMMGARSVHPVNVCVGGFYHAPTLSEVDIMLRKLRDAEADVVALIRWLATLELPQFPQDITFVSLKHPYEYPLNEGNLVSNKGLNVPISEYEKHFTEFHAVQSTALHSILDDKPYLVGPLSRLNLCYEQLPQKILDIIEEIGLKLPSMNMFDSIIARAIENYYAILEAVRILEHYSIPDSPRVTDIKPKAGEGFGCTEAPRGICWHHYETDDKGLVTKARIVPPTSQNQPRIEEDLILTLEKYGLKHSDDELRLMGEMVIRNYDPCISCSVHFLDMRVNRK